MKNLKIKIGKIDKLILFGGGALLVHCAKEARKRGIATYVFVVKRHLEERIDENRVLTLRQVLESEKIPFSCVKNINNSKELKSMVSSKTLGIGLGEAYVFNKQTIDLFKGKLFDFMTIKLPQYRGGAHFTWQILRQDKTGCWNIQAINEKMIPGVYDSGEILMKRVYKIPAQARIPQDYFNSAYQQGIKLFSEFINKVRAVKTFNLTRLSEANSSYLPRLNTLRHGYIDWSWQTDEIERFICAFDEPYPGASTFLEGEKIFLKQCRLVYDKAKSHPFISGIIIRIYKGIIYIATRGGVLAIQKALDMKGNDVITKMKVGQRFYTPNKYLEDAMMFSAEYGAEGLILKRRHK